VTQCDLSLDELRRYRPLRPEPADFDASHGDQAHGVPGHLWVLDAIRAHDAPASQPRMEDLVLAAGRAIEQVREVSLDDQARPTGGLCRSAVTTAQVPLRSSESGGKSVSKNPEEHGT